MSKPRYRYKPRYDNFVKNEHGNVMWKTINGWKRWYKKHFNAPAENWQLGVFTHHEEQWIRINWCSK